MGFNGPSERPADLSQRFLGGCMPEPGERRPMDAPAPLECMDDGPGPARPPPGVKSYRLDWPGARMPSGSAWLRLAEEALHDLLPAARQSAEFDLPEASVQCGFCALAAQQASKAAMKI